MNDRYLSVLRHYWGYDDFRGIQRQIIESIGAGRDTLGLMPTGGGKSIAFQVPALCQPGVCIVITPLIALMKDQVQHLRARGILASAVYSGMTHDEILVTLDNCILGNTKFLYISPERISTPLFQQKFSHMNVSFITVDEAHCISMWGYDFRPSYLKVAEIRRLKPAVPVLALTATATPEVVDDIQERLLFREKNVFRMSFVRQNLSYEVRSPIEKEEELIRMLKSTSGSAIVYVRSRRRTSEIAERLNVSGITATFYHAGLDPSVKDQRQQQWQRDEVRVMVATNAFGMGIDKPDVRLVVHIDCPDSLEAYFQEAGRAGRDGKKACAAMLFYEKDKSKLKRRVADNFPDKDFIRDVYEHLAYFYYIPMGSGYGRTHLFRIFDFCKAYNYNAVHVDSALRLLQYSGYIEYETDPADNSRVMFLLTRSELYKLEDLTPQQENVLNSLLRLYGGLFTDYAFIDENFLAFYAKLSPEELHLTLKTLSKRHIISFIPRRTEPYISFLTDRVEMQHLIIPDQVYENRKRQLERRIESVLDYVKDEKKCRSQLLSSYFGETGVSPCGICDVCRSATANPKASADEARSAILSLLADRQPHPLTEIRNLPIPIEFLSAALTLLVEEEEVVYSGNDVRLAD